MTAFIPWDSGGGNTLSPKLFCDFVVLPLDAPL